MKHFILQLTQNLMDQFAGIFPNLVAAVFVLLTAYVLIRIILRMTRSTLARVLSEEEEAIREFWMKLAGGFLWFSAVLVLLNVLGMESLAASLGTATGFVALGISFALKDILSDLVAGLYLIRDEEFQPGDRISCSVVTGELKRIEFRKCRFRDDDGNDVVVANTDIEKKWTRVRDASGEPEAGEVGG